MTQTLTMTNNVQRTSGTRQKHIIQRESSGTKLIEQSHIRLWCITACFILTFLTLSYQLVDITVFPKHNDTAKLDTNGTTSDGVPPPAPLMRGDIVDRNGLIVATTIPTQLLYANPKEITHPETVAQQLIRIFPDLDRKELLKRLRRDTEFEDIRNYLTPKEVAAVNNLGIPGLYFKAQGKRVYPYRNLLSHVVGYVGRDNDGQAGVEEYFDKELRDTRTNREPIRLSIDVRLQNIVHEEVEKGMKEFDAVGASGIVLDLHTGEILSLVSLPDFDPNHIPRPTDTALFDRATLGSYEMGSTFKTFTIAMALDDGIANMNESFDATHPIEFAHCIIHDDHPKNRWLTVPEIYTYSSNIGTVRIVMNAGKDRQQDFLHKVGLMTPVHIEVPEIGISHYPKEWSELSSMTISYGHGMSVTPLHLIRAFAAIVNGGFLRPLTLIKDGNMDKPQAPRVISEKTSIEMRRLMRMVVEYGTGKQADVPGYRVGGKTGTAEKVKSTGGYNHKSNLAVFVSTFPVDNPQYAVLVIIDEPKGNKQTHGFTTAGWIAAPITGDIISRMGPMYGIRPVFDVPENAVNQYWVNNANQKLMHEVSY